VSDEAPLRFVPGVEPPEPGGEPALWLCFRARDLLVDSDGGVLLVNGPDELGQSPVRTQYLGRLGPHACWSAELPSDAQPPPGMRFRDLRALFGTASETLYALAGRAVQLMDWDRTHQFCGACGERTEPQRGERARRCPRCELLFFPRIAPAVIVQVTRGDEILLARSPHFPPGFMSVPAGFVEPGETLEEAVVREIEEETGIVVGDVRYFASQPWPFPNSLMLGFTARYAGGDLKVDGKEIEAADWFRADAMPPYFKGRISISGWLIEDFLAKRGSERRAT
jgi:NAD+ diphosphatase